MAKKVGTLIKEARTAAGMTQEQLARKIKGLSAGELAKAESGETELTQALLKEIAKATGVTQSSLLSAAKTASAKKTTAASRTATAKKTTTAASKTSTAKKASTAKKTASKDADTLTAAEKKLVEAYRAASSDAKKNALKILKGEDLDMAEIMKLLKLDSKLENLGSGGILGGLKEGLIDGLLGKK
ncbi:MAG: helix-turn-helix transcriptional regulator [Oscillospiraceae bacterium]|nr:helix-turn-helix transcriptional regulator [Oscillospiraceae bacterium]